LIFSIEDYELSLQKVVDMQIQFLEQNESKFKISMHDGILYTKIFNYLSINFLLYFTDDLFNHALNKTQCYKFE